MKRIIFIALTVSALLFSCKDKEKSHKIADDSQLQTVELATVESQNLTDQINASGILSSKSELKLAFKTGGMIKRMYVTEGQSVAAGQLLAELDMAEIDAQVNQAKVGFQKAKRDFDRVKKLYDDQAATQTNLQDANSGLEMATQALTAAEFNRKLSKIFAPASGKILRKIAEQGELIVPFSPALILGTGANAYILNVGLADKEIVKLKIGDKANVELDAYPNEKFSAKVSQLAQTINPATGTYEVELEMQPTNKKLISGFVAKVNILPSTSNNSLVLPITAVVEADAQNAFVYIFDANTGKVSKKPVKIGKIYDDTVELISGVNRGEKVVTRGSGFVADGEKVKLFHP
jgi:RND family efflux transporter MFP subunit